MSREGKHVSVGALSDSTVDAGGVLRKFKVIAVVGISRYPEKEANEVPAYLQKIGYHIIPVNPAAVAIIGEKAYPSLAAIPEELAARVDVVEVFRPSEEFPYVARQVADMRRRTGRPFVFWGQLGLRNDEAKGILKEAKVDYVMDRCMKIEHFKLTMKSVNEAWHRLHPLPANPTREERVAWRAEHASACGCAPVPSDLAEVRARRTATIPFRPDPRSKMARNPK